MGGVQNDIHYKRNNTTIYSTVHVQVYHQKYKKSCSLEEIPRQCIRAVSGIAIGQH
jgi:hypothetical protein